MDESDEGQPVARSVTSSVRTDTPTVTLSTMARALSSIQRADGQPGASAQPAAAGGDTGDTGDSVALRRLRECRSIDAIRSMCYVDHHHLPSTEDVSTFVNELPVEFEEHDDFVSFRHPLHHNRTVRLSTHKLTVRTSGQRLRSAANEVAKLDDALSDLVLRRGEAVVRFVDTQVEDRIYSSIGESIEREREIASTLKVDLAIEKKRLAEKQRKELKKQLLERKQQLIAASGSKRKLSASSDDESDDDEETEEDKRFITPEGVKLKKRRVIAVEEKINVQFVGHDVRSWRLPRCKQTWTVSRFRVELTRVTGIDFSARVQGFGFGFSLCDFVYHLSFAGRPMVEEQTLRQHGVGNYDIIKGTFGRPGESTLLGMSFDSRAMVEEQPLRQAEHGVNNIIGSSV